MEKSQLKTIRVNIRATCHQKNLIAQAAKIKQITVSNFILEKACEAAQQIISEKSHFLLSPQKWEAFSEALDTPPKNILALKKLLTEPGVFDE